MRLPQGDWIIVERNVRDCITRGMIMKSGLTEHTARRLTVKCRLIQERQLREGTTRTECNYWAMDKKDY